ncbi:MAG: tetraacyldisaccharide 4'-kinase, partial [Oxalobacteraceae bacterium]
WRREWYIRHPQRQRRLERPVISVGNLRVGGAGKTPIVEHIARLLVARAAELELTRPLFYALRYAVNLLHSPIPSDVLDAARIGRPDPFTLQLVDALFKRALMSPHPSCSDWFTGLARRMLYVRANWLRMPPLLLSRHLFHKTFIAPKPE